VILSAAMSSTASELNALSTITTMDFYQKWQKTEINPEKLLKVSKLFTLLWGLLAISFASFGTLFENLIQLVNIIGSIFYGTVLGIFLTAFFLKQVLGKAVFYAGLFTQVFVIFLYYFAIHIQPAGEELLGYLWLNLIGCGLTMLLSLALQKVFQKIN
jgi:solute:Na+ symporter, SSS family